MIAAAKCDRHHWTPGLRSAHNPVCGVRRSRPSLGAEHVIEAQEGPTCRTPITRLFYRQLFPARLQMRYARAREADRSVSAELRHLLRNSFESNEAALVEGGLAKSRVASRNASEF